jgi:YD repeat-containing protein
MNAVKHSGCWGVPARPSAPLCCAQDVAVALSAKTRADHRAAGFPLQSLTRNAVLILALCLTCGLWAQLLKPYRFMSEGLLRAKHVKCITVYSEKPGGRSKNQELCFDVQGKLVQVLTFWGNPVQADTEKYVYDSAGRELSYTSVRSIADGLSASGERLMKRVTVSYTSEYDQDRLLRSIGNDGAYLMTGSHYTEVHYDTLGQVIERIYRDTVDHEAQRAVFVHDKKGNEILYLHYDERDQVSAFEVKSYDENGRETNSELRNASKYSDYQTTTRYFYDPAGKLVREERLDDGKPDMIEYDYRYDSSGLLTQIVSNIMKDSFEYTYH